MSWTQLAAVCPQDGATPCQGTVGGRDVTDWVWATDAQVVALFSYYEPDILTSPSVSGFPYFFTASAFLGAFQPTQSVFLTYFFSEFAGGWTASQDSTGLPIAGGVGAGGTLVSVSGAFSVTPVTNADESIAARGVFLWRATGLGSDAVYAYGDAGQVASPAGGTAVANVLANDWVAGAPATSTNAVLSQEWSSAAGVSLDTADGSVDVAA